MNDEEILEIVFEKLYDKLDSVAYDCEEYVDKCFEKGLISESRHDVIKNTKETCDKNRYVTIQ